MDTGWVPWKGGKRGGRGLRAGISCSSYDHIVVICQNLVTRYPPLSLSGPASTRHSTLLPEAAAGTAEKGTASGTDWEASLPPCATFSCWCQVRWWG